MQEWTALASSQRSIFSGASPRQGPLEHSIRAWLQSVGLSFDPFALLEASMDARLSSYLVGHEAFSVAWGEWHSLVYAPTGGGKTALRARVVQSCWIGQETSRPFPISYTPPFLKWGHATPSINEHLDALAEAGALGLLLALVYHPHWFLRLSPEHRQMVKQALEWCLPGDLEFFIDSWETEQNLYSLHKHFAPAFLPPNLPEAHRITQFYKQLIDTPGTAFPCPNASQRWSLLCGIILRLLKAPSLYILLDGLDASPDTAENPEASVACLEPLLRAIEELSSQHIFLKCFIPLELQTIVEETFPELKKHAQSVAIHWTPDLLAEVVRRRVYAASQGVYGSLAALTSPEYPDIETVLAKMVIPLPREMLLITRQVLIEHIKNNQPSPKILSKDVELAFEWYKKQTPWINERIQIN